jgi:hypothetical protein
LPSKGGGLALCWSKEVSIDLINFSPHHIDAIVQQDKGIKWRSTFVYGEPCTQQRPEFWKLLKRIKPNKEANLPWLMLGDFNEAMWQSEHLSCNKRSEKRMQDFRDTMRFCDLHDLGYSGVPWTYNNKQEGMRNVKVRLDRAVANPAWCNLFNAASVKHIISSRSDHLPLILQMGKLEENNCKSSFHKYESMWEREESLGEEINEAWEAAGQVQNLADIKNKLHCTMRALKTWSREKFGRVDREIKKLTNRLEWLYKHNPFSHMTEIKHVSARMDELLLREEIMWRQRSRITWLKEGDQNTKYFHRRATSRAKKNRIKTLKTVDDKILQSKEEILEYSRDYFLDLFTKDQQVDPSPLLDIFIECCVT